MTDINKYGWLKRNSKLLKPIKDLCKLYNFDIPFNNKNIKIKSGGEPDNILIYLNDPPQTICWHIKNDRITKNYSLNGKPHRDNGPAVYGRDGTVIYEYYYINGVRHRDDGPACIHQYSDETIYAYYINGNHISNELIEKYPNILIDKYLQKILL